MAEIIERAMEQMAVEFEQILRTGVLDENEIRLMAKKLRYFESRINGYSRRITDYKDYIEYNYNVYRLVKARRARVKHGTNITSIMFGIIRRTIALFDKAFIRYPSDKSLYLSYFDFCRNTNTQVTYDICERMLQYHHADVESWIIAAKWQYDAQKYHFAISLLQKGLQFHPKCGDLYVNLVRYEFVRTLGEVTSLNDDVDEETVETFLKKISKYVECMEKLVEDTECYMQLLEQVEKYEVSEILQKQIIDFISEKYANTAVLWECLAQHERRRFRGEIKNTIQLTINKYKEGLELLEGKEKEKLAVFCIRCILDIKEEEYRVCKLTKEKFLLESVRDISKFHPAIRNNLEDLVRANREQQSEVFAKKSSSSRTPEDTNEVSPKRRKAT